MVEFRPVRVEVEKNDDAVEIWEKKVFFSWQTVLDFSDNLRQSVLYQLICWHLSIATCRCHFNFHKFLFDIFADDLDISANIESITYRIDS